MRFICLLLIFGLPLTWCNCEKIKLTLWSLSSLPVFPLHTHKQRNNHKLHTHRRKHKNHFLTAFSFPKATVVSSKKKKKQIHYPASKLFLTMNKQPILLFSLDFYSSIIFMIQGNDGAISKTQLDFQPLTQAKLRLHADTYDYFLAGKQCRGSILVSYSLYIEQRWDRLPVGGIGPIYQSFKQLFLWCMALDTTAAFQQCWASYLENVVS